MNNIGYTEHGIGILDPDAYLSPIVGDCRICGNGIHKGSEERIDGEIVCVSCFKEAESPELKV